MAETEKKHAILFSGSCACGRISYKSTALPSSGQTCHCVTCRKISGSAFQAFADIPAKQVIWIDKKESSRYDGLPQDDIGGITLLRLMAGAERAFCLDCHSELAMRYMHDPDVVGVTLGTIDEHSIRDEETKASLKPQSHIFASQNPWWFDITADGLPLRDRFGGDYEEKWTAWVGKDSK